jgi:KDO2-lipid IV(A) lauroyltransferase
MRVKESLSRDLLRLFVWYPLRLLVERLPPARGLAVYRAMGDLHWRLARGKRSLLEERIARIDRAVGTAARSPGEQSRLYFRNHYVDRLFIFLFPRMTRAHVDALTDFSGLHHLDAALAAGRGAVLVHPHFGPVHLPLVGLHHLGYRMVQIGMPSTEGLSWVGRKVAFRLRLRYEARIPAPIVKADGYLKPVFRALRDNKAVMITGDGTGTDQRLGRQAPLPFLDAQALFPLGPALLAKKTGAWLLPMFITPGRAGTYRVTIEEPLARGTVEDPEPVMAAFAARYAEQVAACPGFMHFLDRLAPGEFLL